MDEALAAGPDTVDERVCSARGCRAEAAWGLLWNNPKLHTAERRKVWLACDAHRAHLEHFLSARSFLRGTVAVTELDGAPTPSGVPEQSEAARPVGPSLTPRAADPSA